MAIFKFSSYFLQNSLKPDVSIWNKQTFYKYSLDITKLSLLLQGCHTFRIT